MSPNLEKKLFKKFPQLFRDKDKPPTESLMCFGIEASDGWFKILFKLCQDIMATNPDQNFRFSQIKEKYGCLRIYPMGGASEEIWELLDKAEVDSATICEQCGKPSRMISAGWIYNMCNECWLEFAKKRGIYEWKYFDEEGETPL